VQISGVEKGTAAWSRCEVVTLGMVESVTGNVIRGRETKENERGRENYTNASASCANGSKNGVEGTNEKSLGRRDRL
jgi:hypothetical protein